MRTIILSPHLDDAALSLGGWISDRSAGGQSVEIWTLMAGVPPTEELSEFARSMHAKWTTGGARQTVESRRLEDLDAAAILGAAAVHFQFLDAILRRDTGGSPVYEDPVGAQVHPADVELPVQIRSALEQAPQPDDSIFCLLGVGNHVDHVIVRRAAELLDLPLTYAADFPYVIQHPDAIAAKTAGLHGSLAVVTLRGLEAWQAAVAAYRSQVTAVFEGSDPSLAIQEYWAPAQGIRLWRQ